MTNPILKAKINALRKASKNGAPLWEALASELERSKRSRVAVNLSAINRFSTDGDVVAVPGKVLGSGALSHPVTVAAYSFSETAKRKIVQAEGRAVSLTELLAEGVEPSKIKILK